jgi:tetratricopeptide (TPR) repeat protein
MKSLPAVAVYNQGRLSPDELIATFVARRDVLATLVHILRAQASGAAPEHQIIIGVRGMGKTTLLRRLAIEIEQDEALDARFIPLTFREEQYNVIGLDALWRNCAESLAEWCDTHDRAALAERLDRALDAPEWRNPETAAEGFLEACREIGLRPVLLLDNLDLILNALAESDKKTGSRSLWGLRGVLQASDGPLIIGAATQHLAQSGDREAAFYEFFHPHVLEPLTAKELFACLHALADLRQEAGRPVKAILARQPARLRTLYTLTGGNPRVLVLIYQLLERMESDTVFSDLDALLDQVTPLYKARVEEYQTPQQRAVIDAIALHWDPITTRDLAEISGIEQTSLSSHLKRLRNNGFVEEVETSGASAGFQIAERFLNIWYLMRHGTRKTRQKLRWLTRLLTHLYTPDDLARMAEDARDGDMAGRMHPHYREALLAAVEECGGVSQAFADVQAPDDSMGESEKRLILEASNLFEKGGEAFFEERYEDAIAACDEVVARFGAADQPALQEKVATALFNKGVTLGQLGRSEDAIAAYDEVVARFGASDQSALQEAVALALVNKGVTLGQLGRNEDEIAAYDEVIGQFGASDQPALQEQVAKALFFKGLSLVQLGRREDAIAAYDEVIGRFGASDQSALQEQVAEALFFKGISLGQLGRPEDAIAAFDMVIGQFGAADQSDLQEQLDRALSWKGHVLHDDLGDLEGAEAAWRRAREMDIPFSGGTYFLVWLLLSQARLDDAEAMRPVPDPERLDPVDALLIDAGFALARDNLGTALEHLATALDAGLDREHGSIHDLLPFLRLAEARGYGDKLIAWFETSGNADRYAPVHAAFVAYVKGEERLRDVNPEVRAPAKDLYEKLDKPRLARAKREGRPQEAPTAGRKPRRKR